MAIRASLAGYRAYLREKETQWFWAWSHPATPTVSGKSTRVGGGRVPILTPSPVRCSSTGSVSRGGCSAAHATRPHMRRQGVRGVEKDPQRARERLGLLPVDEVAAVLEADQLAVLQQGGGGRAMGDGKDGVACSPEEAHGWKLLDFRDPVEKVPRLAPPADDIAHRPRERAGGPWLAQVGSQQGDLGRCIA